MPSTESCATKLKQEFFSTYLDSPDHEVLEEELLTVA